MQDIKRDQRVWYETSYGGPIVKRYGTVVSDVLKNPYGQDEVKVKWDDSDVPTYHLVKRLAIERTI
jgi:hypothetical protein